MKRCSSCGITKPESEFYPHISHADGLSSRCKACYKIANMRRRRTKRGLVSAKYSQQVAKSIRRGHNPPSYSREELIEYALNSEEFCSLYEKWVSSGYDKWRSPSFDRIDDSIGYSFDNIRIVTWMENDNDANLKTKMGLINKGKRQRPVVVTDISSGKDTHFHSLSEASRATGLRRNRLWECCNGHRDDYKNIKCRYKLKQQKR